MRPLLLISAFFFIYQLAAFGQAEEVATLQSRLATVQGQERVDLLLRLSTQLGSAQPTQAQAYAEEAFELSQGLDYLRGIMTAAYFLGDLEKGAGHHRKAADLLETGVAAARSAGDQSSELLGLQHLITVYQLSKRSKKLAETELLYQKLKNQLDLDQRSEALAGLKEAYQSKAAAMHESETQRQQIRHVLNLTMEDKLRQEAELERLAREKAELELKTLQLENESTKNALALSEKEKEVLAIEARLKHQQYLQVMITTIFAVALIIITFLLWLYKEKRDRAEEKVSLQRQLMMQEKMATLGQLTAGIAHEIKNPLNLVNNFAEGSKELAEELAETVPKSNSALQPDQYLQIREIVDDLKQNAVDIISNGKRLDRIVHSMMEHARGDKGKPQLVEINLLVEETINLAYHGYRALIPSFQVNIQKQFDLTIPGIKAIPQDLTNTLESEAA